MLRQPLGGRRVHIAGSISTDPATASADAVALARAFVEQVVVELVRKGATFVVPVDADKCRDDGMAICFDWLIWETIQKNVFARPAGASAPLVIAVQHYKNEEQIPEKYVAMWEQLRSSDLVQIDNAAQWDMASKRREIQARHGDILLTLGGGEGVLHLANLYHDAGKPVVPLNFKLCSQSTGSRRLFDFGMASGNTARLFRTEGTVSPHGWINRINFTTRHDVAHQVRETIALLEALEPPTAFCVRLLNPTVTEHYDDVETYFSTVVQPVVEGELGFKMVTVDGSQPNEFARIDQEIFNRLHRCRVALVDITGIRPNCFIELGYALGRQLPTILLAKDETNHPFDIASLAALHWKPSDLLKAKRDAFRIHWEANRNRPPLVSVEPLIP